LHQYLGKQMREEKKYTYTRFSFFFFFDLKHC
jgi:hypothetical protein